MSGASSGSESGSQTVRSAQPPRLTHGGADLQHEIALHLETLRDLGPDYTEPVARALVSQLDELIELRVQEALQAGEVRRGSTLREKQRFVLLILGFGIPLLAIAGGEGGAFGLMLMVIALFILAIIAMMHNF